MNLHGSADGARTKRIPALSWDSVVDTAPRWMIRRRTMGKLARRTRSPSRHFCSTWRSPADIDEPVGDVRFEPFHLDEPAVIPVPVPVAPVPVVPVAAAPVAAAPVPVAPVPAAPVAAAPVPVAPVAVAPVAAAPVAAAAPVPTPPVEAPPVEAPPVETMSAPALDESLTIRTTPPAVIVPAIGDVTSGPDQIASLAAPPAAAPSAPAVSDALPQIQEATPVESAAPLLPSIPALAPRPVAATPFEFDPASVAPAPTQQPRRRKQRRGIKLFATLLVLGGLVAAGIVFGQAYLFPGEWDDATAPYAEAVETASEVEFAEPLSIVAEPTADFATRLQTQFASIPPEEMAQWRALGLASGVVDDATIAQQLSGWQDAVYSTARRPGVSRHRRCRR